MNLTRHGLIMMAILAVASAPAFASAPASSQTLCNAIGSEISRSPQATPVKTAPEPELVASHEAATEDAGASGSTSGGGEVLVEPRGRWKTLLPGTFK